MVRYGTQLEKPFSFGVTHNWRTSGQGKPTGHVWVLYFGVRKSQAKPTNTNHAETWTDFGTQADTFSADIENYCDSHSGQGKNGHLAGCLLPFEGNLPENTAASPPSFCAANNALDSGPYAVSFKMNRKRDRNAPQTAISKEGRTH